MAWDDVRFLVAIFHHRVGLRECTCGSIRGKHVAKCGSTSFGVRAVTNCAVVHGKCMERRTNCTVSVLTL